MTAISIVIPMRDEEAFVAACLDSVLRQTPGRVALEILCVDGGSMDRTRAIAIEHAQRDARVKVLDNPAGTTPAALNIGIRAARGDVIIRLDCHCQYPPDYVRNCLAVLERTGADNVGGYLHTRAGKDTPIGRAVASALSSAFGIGSRTFRTRGPERAVDTVPFGCFRREVFDRVGLFDERLVRNQDIELNSRIRQGGGRIVIAPEIQCTYFAPATYRAMRRQAFRNGLWNLYTVYLGAHGLSARHFAPLAFLLSILVLGGAGFAASLFWRLLAGELALYLVCAVLAVLAAGRRRGASRLLLLVAFVQLHLSYGFGSLCGLLTARPRFGRAKHGATRRPDKRNKVDPT